MLEYLTAEIVELAGNAVKANRNKRIHPQHIQLAIRNDAELDALLKDVIIPGGGVLTHNEPMLPPKKIFPQR